MKSLADIVAEMRALGVTRLKTADMEIDLGAPPPPPPAEKKQGDESDKEISEEAKKEKQWYTFWTKANRSSGAAIPPYPRQRPRVEPVK